MSLKFHEVKLGGISSRALKILLPGYLLLTVAYTAWRFTNVPHWHVWYAYPLFATEIYSILFTISFLFTTRRILQPVHLPPLIGVSVDIFITTYNEPEDIVKMTMLGALHVQGARYVYVLDDGNRPSIRAMVEQAGARYVYRTNNVHAKAGNMNNGIQYSDAEFMVFLDCDHVPQANFIERTSGFFIDERLAFVQTPQLFYNADSIQFRKIRGRNFWNEQSMFYEAIQPAKNAFNAAFFCGSGSMLRRSAIDAVGGFATGTATEDIHTSMRLHARGWNSLFLSEQLAHGIAAEDIGEYHKQRVRWGAGSLGLLFRSPDSPLWARGLSIMQRLCYINSTLAFLNGVHRLIYILLPAGILLFLPLQHQFPAVSLYSYTVVALPFVIISYYVTYIFSRRTFHPLYTEQFNIANIFANILATKGIFNVQKKFKVSLKRRSIRRESSAYRALLFMWAFTLLAALASPLFWYIDWQRSTTQLLHSAVAVSMLWNFINLYFISTTIWYINFHDERETNNNALKIGRELRATTQGEQSIQLHRISLRGADIFSPAKLPQTLKLVVGNDLLLSADVVSSKHVRGHYRSSVEFHNNTLADETKLTLFMFHRMVPKLYKNEFKFEVPEPLRGFTDRRSRTREARNLVERQENIQASQA